MLLSIALRTFQWKNQKKKKKNKNKKPGDETNGTTAAPPENDLIETEATTEQTQSKKKKKGKSNATTSDVGGENDGNTKKKGDKKSTTQTTPPSVPISQLFPSGQFPQGQIMDHPIAANDATAKTRFSSEESRALDRIQLDMYNEVRQAAEAHRQTRQYIQSWVKPGMKMIDICEELEKTGRALINE